MHKCTHLYWCGPSTPPQRTIGILCTSVSVSPYQVSLFPASGILQIAIKPLTIQVRPHNSAIHLLFRRPIIRYYCSISKFQRPVYCCLFYSCLFGRSVSQQWAIQFRVSIWLLCSPLLLAAGLHLCGLLAAGLRFGLVCVYVTR